MRSSALRPLRLPPPAAFLAFAILIVPVVGTVAAPPAWAGVVGLLWLLALVPIGHATRLHGWRGAAVVLGGTMALLLLVHLATAALERPTPGSLAIAIPLLLLLGSVIGWTSGRRPFPGGADAGTGGWIEGQDPGARRTSSAVLFEVEASGVPGSGKGEGSGSRGGTRPVDPALASLREIVGEAAVKGEVPGVPPTAVLALLEGASEEAATGFAQRVRDAFEGEAHAPLRAGVASRHAAMASLHDLIAAALLALARAREGAPGSIRVFGRPAAAPGGASLPMLKSPAHPPLPATVGPAARSPSLIDEGPARPSQVTPDGSGRRVLLVDDETPLRALVSMHLRRMGFSVVEGADPAEGIRALREEFDAVITDLPADDDEANLISAVKARWPATPVVAITGFGDARLAAEALQAGADRYLFKPFGIAELGAHLADLLVRRDRRVRNRETAGEEGAGDDAPAREAILEGARALVRAVEVRDPFTQGHAERVAAYGLALLEALEQTGGPAGIDRQRLRLACELYDIGKLSVPAAVLNKAGRLSEEEYRRVREHPRVGHRILSLLVDDELVLAVTAWHHERWDGQGYPDRLGGEAIPLPARLVAVADSLDAMTSPRAYRAGLAWDDAVGQIRARTGTQFDPGLLAAFERALPRLERIHREASFHAPPGSGGSPRTGGPISSSRPSPESEETR